MPKFFEAALRPFTSQILGDFGNHRKSANAKIYASMPLVHLVQQVEDLANIGFWRLDQTTGEIIWSPGVFAIHDVPITEKVELDNALAFYPPHHRPVIDAALKKALTEGIPFDLELDFISAKGVLKRVRAMCCPQISRRKVVAADGLFQDITARYLAKEKLQSTNLVDELTGGPNARHIEQFYNDLGFADANSISEPFAFIMVNIDGLDQIGAKFGRAAQTSVLQTIAGRLQQPFGVLSFAARIGVDDFGLLLRNPGDFDAVCEVARRIGQTLQQTVTILDQPDQTEVEIAVALGCILSDSGGVPFTRVLADAETAMRHAYQSPVCTAIVSHNGEKALFSYD